MVKRFYKPDILAYLRKYGVSSERSAIDICNGFDLTAPVYEQPLSPGERIFQFKRLPSVGERNPTTGNWFCLKGGMLARLAIHSPGPRRYPVEFEVINDILVLEGIAKNFDPVLEEPNQEKRRKLFEYGVGGKGGGTQIYIPRFLMPALRQVGINTDISAYAGI